MPLIDVVFLLLTFFVFSLALMIRADVLGVSLPGLSTGERAGTRETITLTVLADGTYAVEGEAVAREQVVQRIEAARRARTDPTLLIATDTGAPAGALVWALEQLSAADITEFKIVGRPTE